MHAFPTSGWAALLAPELTPSLQQSRSCHRPLEGPLDPHLRWAKPCDSYRRIASKAKSGNLSLCIFEGERAKCAEKGLSGKKKAHKHKLFCPAGLGTNPGLSRGSHRVCPWDKFGENLGEARVFSLFYTVEARFHRDCPWDFTGFVPGTIPGTKGGTESLCEKSLCAFFAR